MGTEPAPAAPARVASAEDRASSGAAPPAGGTVEDPWQALALRVAAERHRLEADGTIDLGEPLALLGGLLAAGPGEAVTGTGALALRDELERLVQALAGALDAAGHEIGELDRQRRALVAYATRARPAAP